MLIKSPSHPIPSHRIESTVRQTLDRECLSNLTWSLPRGRSKYTFHYHVGWTGLFSGYAQSQREVSWPSSAGTCSAEETFDQSASGTCLDSSSTTNRQPALTVGPARFPVTGVWKENQPTLSSSRCVGKTGDRGTKCKIYFRFGISLIRKYCWSDLVNSVIVITIILLKTSYMDSDFSVLRTLTQCHTGWSISVLGHVATDWFLHKKS